MPKCALAASVVFAEDLNSTPSSFYVKPAVAVVNPWKKVFHTVATIMHLPATTEVLYL